MLQVSQSRRPASTDLSRFPQWGQVGTLRPRRRRHASQPSARTMSERSTASRSSSGLIPAPSSPPPPAAVNKNASSHAILSAVFFPANSIRDGGHRRGDLHHAEHAERWRPQSPEGAAGLDPQGEPGAGADGREGPGPVRRPRPLRLRHRPGSARQRDGLARVHRVRRPGLGADDDPARDPAGCVHRPAGGRGPRASPQAQAALIRLPAPVKVLKIVPEKCTGCLRCELACSYVQTGAFQPAKSVIRVSPYEGHTSYAPYTCTQCAEGWCMTACPVGAITITAAGAKDVVDDRCVGCKLCTIACPYGTIFYDHDTRKAFKCALCGAAPACAGACPTAAIVYAEAETADWLADFAVERSARLLAIGTPLLPPHTPSS